MTDKISQTKGISGKVVVITGASSGLGEATARYLAARGAKVALAARRTDKLEAVAQDICSQGGEAQAYTVDVTKKEDVNALVQDVLKEFGRLDVMINNAGLMPLAPMSDCRTDEWDQMVDVNVKGVLYGIAAALPVFMKQKSGQFVNLSSVAGIKVFAPGGTVYSGTKYAVRAISDGLRQEMSPHNIRVTTIEPGAVDSELKYSTQEPEARKAVLDFYKNAIPADAVARAVAYAIEQPEEVDINEIVLRPTTQEF